MSDGNGWSKWEQHVLAELRRLNDGINETRGAINGLGVDVSAFTTNAQHLAEEVKEHSSKIDSLNMKFYGVLGSIGILTALLAKSLGIV